MIAVVLALATLTSMVICHQLAKARSASRVFWVMMGALFGPLAIPFAMRAKPKRTATADRQPEA